MYPSYWRFWTDAVIHCAAHTAVDAAESDIDAAYLINATGSRNVALASEKAGAKLVYISTDYVFDGMGAQPYHEYDNTDPKSIYGKSKRAGEVLVQSSPLSISSYERHGCTANTEITLSKQC